jgi:hypothetical protein
MEKHADIGKLFKMVPGVGFHDSFSLLKLLLKTRLIIQVLQNVVIVDIKHFRIINLLNTSMQLLLLLLENRNSQKRNIQRRGLIKRQNKLETPKRRRTRKKDLKRRRTQHLNHLQRLMRVQPLNRGRVQEQV